MFISRKKLHALRIEVERLASYTKMLDDRIESLANRDETVELLREYRGYDPDASDGFHVTKYGTIYYPGRGHFGTERFQKMVDEAALEFHRKKCKVKK